MAKSIHRLSALTVRTVTRPGLHADGAGLYLQVGTRGSKSWLYRYTRNGRARTMGLGSVNAVTLAEARDLAENCRRALARGIDPIDARQEEHRRQRLEAARVMTFKNCAEAYIQAHEAGWRNEKHAGQWNATLANYVYPVFGDLPVQVVDTALVIRVLEPIWRTKTETASRVRGRIEAVLDWATSRKYRQGDNPARWKGHMENLLPPRSKVRRVVHHPALPFEETGTFMAELRRQDGIAARGLEFQVLTAARTGEVIGARWGEFDLGKKVWTIPAERMKSGKQHRVPLSSAALAILEKMREVRQSDFVFPGAVSRKPLSSMAFLQLLKRMKRDDLTAHGFRSTFRDWAAERTGYPRDVVEMALAHTIRDRVEAAYRRGDLFEKRRRLMEDWAKYCAASPAVTEGKVVALGKGG